MGWQPLPRIAFAVAVHPFAATEPHDLPLELGDELYIIEQGGKNGAWFRGYLIAAPSLLSGLTSTQGQTLQARVFQGIFPRSCVEIREVLGEDEDELLSPQTSTVNGHPGPDSPHGSDVRNDSRMTNGTKGTKRKRGLRDDLRFGTLPPVTRNPEEPPPAAPVPMLNIGDDTPMSLSEPLVDEIASCMREWHSTNLHELVLSRRYKELEEMQSLVQKIGFARRQLLNNVLTEKEAEVIREQTVWDLVKGNKILSGEVIVRSPTERGRLLVSEDSAIDITSLQAQMSCLDQKAVHKAEVESLHHLLVDVKGFAGASTDASKIVLYLASRGHDGSAPTTLSESYVLNMPGKGAIGQLPKSMRALFTDLTAADIGDNTGSSADVFLVAKVIQSQKAAQSTPSQPQSRSGMASRENLTTSLSEKSINQGSVGKAARRSLMWGKSAPRASGRSTVSKMQPVDEKDWEPPHTANSSLRSDKGSTTTKLVNKTVGVGVLKVNELLKEPAEAEQVISMWSPSTEAGSHREKGADADSWDEVIRDVLDSSTGCYEKSRKAERLHLNLRSFINPDAEALIKATPTLLSNVTLTNKIGFSGAPRKPRSDIYITLDKSFIPKAALLSRVMGSATVLPAHLSCSNLQLSLEVRKSTGIRLDNCIYPASNSDPVSVWTSTVASRNEIWGQTLRLVVPASEVSDCHIAVFISDAPSNPFAIAYIPLWNQGAFLRDGHHSLLMYKYDETTNHPNADSTGKGGYLNGSWSSRTKDDVSKDESITGPLSTLRVQTYLCSTKFSQDKVLLGLLNHKKQSTEEMSTILKRIQFVPEIEIVKLLNDVLDSLLSVLSESNDNTAFEDLVFNALVTVLGIVHDRRFNLGPLVDQYAETKLNYPFAAPRLVRSFIRLIHNHMDPETSKQLRATFKVTRHILKFITHARGQQKSKEEEIGIPNGSPGFEKHLRGIFKALDKLMRNNAPILIGSQTLAVQHFHTWLPELTSLLTVEETFHIAIDFMDACEAVKGKLILYKLILIINYAKLDLFSKPDQQAALAANTVRWISPHWGRASEVSPQWHDQVRLCCSVLASQIAFLGTETPDHIPKIIESYRAIHAAPRQRSSRLSLLFPTTYPFPTKPIAGNLEFDEALVELSAVLAAVSSGPLGMQLELAEDEMVPLLEQTLKVHMSILNCEAFPKSWLSIHIYHHRATMKTLDYICGILLEQYLPQGEDADEVAEFPTELWESFFRTLIKLVGSEALALETFPEQKRRAVWKIAGDVRAEGATLLAKAWEAIGWETSPDESQRYGLNSLGGYQVQYVASLAPAIVELCLSVHEGLRHVAVEVLQTMIASEWELSNDLSQIQTAMIDSLDTIFKSKPINEGTLQKRFISELVQLFDSVEEDDPMFGALHGLLDTIEEFFDLLVAVYSSEDTGPANDLLNRLRLMDFLRDMQKEEIFIRYAHQLAGVQAHAKNITEAGLALKLHADLYEWDPAKILAPLSDPAFPAQTAFERKERIFFEMLQYFEEGEAWSSALDAYNELQRQYADNIFDFAKLARTQKAIGSVYESIVNSDKGPVKYFRVSYRGLGFPVGLRDKEFIIEGAVAEKTAAFSDRLQEMYPAATIVANFTEEEIEGQYLRVSPVTAHRDLEHPVFQRAKVSNIVRDHLLSANCRLFSATTARHTAGPIEEHWVEKAVFTTADTFPTISKRSEIISASRVKLTPLQTALERTIRKTQEMSLIEKRVASGEDEMTPMLLDAVTISISNQADSSVSRYRALLPQPTYQVTEGVDGMDEDVVVEPVFSPEQTALKMALVDHVIMVKRVLGMFGKSENALLRERTEELVTYFESTFSSELATLAPLQRLQPPVPDWMNSKRMSALPPLPTLATQSTMTTVGTSVLNSPQAPTPVSKQSKHKSRLSFLGGGMGKRGPPVSFKLNGTPAPTVNGTVNGSPAKTATDASDGRGRKDSDNSTNRLSKRSGSKTRKRDKSRDSLKRRSWFGGSGVPESQSHGTISTNITGDTGWETETNDSPAKPSGLKRILSNTSANHGGGFEGRPRTDTHATSHTSGTGHSGGSKVGSVRKRLSKLTLGRKPSKRDFEGGMEGVSEDE